MAFSYPEFHGRSDEDVADFMEQMEVACISNHVVAENSILKLFKICMKDDARRWLKDFEAKDVAAIPPQVLTLDRLKEGLLEHFQQVEDPSVLWQELSVLKQVNGQAVDAYVHVFTGLWDQWCMALKHEIPPMFVKKSLFIGGLLPELKVKVEIKNPKSFADAVKIAKEKEWKIMKRMEMEMFPFERAMPVSDMHVNSVGVLQDFASERPKQVQKGIFYVPADFFPQLQTQSKVDEKQVEEATHICLMPSIDDVDASQVDVEARVKDMDVEIKNQEAMPCFESFASEELPMDTLLDLDAMAVQDSDLECSSEGHEEDPDMECFDEEPLQDSIREEDGVETICRVDVEHKEEDLIIMEILGNLDCGMASTMDDVDFLSLDALCDVNSLFEHDTKGEGRTQEDMHAYLSDEEVSQCNSCDLSVVLEGDMWEVASLNEEEPEMEMDASMIESVSKASLHVGEMLKMTKNIANKDVEVVELGGCEAMPALEEFTVYVDTAIVEDVDICEPKGQVVASWWSSQMMMNWMLVVALPQVLKTKMLVVGEVLFYGLQHEQIHEDDDAWIQLQNAYQVIEEGDFIAHMFEVCWYTVTQSLFCKDSEKWVGESRQRPFDPGGCSTLFAAADHE